MMLLGEKLGMSQLFDEKGLVTPVTIVKAGPVVVMQVKTVERDGYSALQIGYGDVKKSRTTKPASGHAKKANTTQKHTLKEIRMPNDNHEYKVGDVIACDFFKAGDVVDVTADTKGHGFTGVIKRWNHHRIFMTHGGGPVHRHVGSMGAGSSPSRVFKNKKMAGQYGGESVTIQNLTVVKVDTDKNCIMIKGGLPGAEGAVVAIRGAKKSAKEVIA